MLDIGDTERMVLEAVGALTSDAKGAEILRGLTESETQFVLQVEKTGSSRLSASDAAKYHLLATRHRYARVIQAVDTRAFAPFSS